MAGPIAIVSALILFWLGFRIIVKYTNQHRSEKNYRKQQADFDFKIQHENFAWYQSTHPVCVSKGRVTCFSCGGNRIQAERMMNQTYTRRHFCVTCGKTLYYSPESR